MLETISTWTTKLWHGKLTVGVVKSNEILALLETHMTSGGYNIDHSDKHCVKVTINLTTRIFSWLDRKGNVRKSEVNDTIRKTCLLAIDRFVLLLGKHLKKEFDEEKMPASTWKHIRNVLWRGLSTIVPDKETKDARRRFDKSLMLRKLHDAGNTANYHGFPEIKAAIEKLIEEVRRDG